jgi:hypothetical protein
MRRSSLALGASMITLALTGGDAMAQTPAQDVVGSVAGVQVTAVEVEAPVRVLSPGDAAAPAPAPAAEPQAATESTGAVQVAGVQVKAPVRVASRGDDDAAPAPAGPEPAAQAATGSTGAVQAKAVTVRAPVRVLSRGDDEAPAEPAPAQAGGTNAQEVEDSVGALQVAAPAVTAPLRILSPGDDTTTPAAETPTSPGTTTGVGVTPPVQPLGAIPAVAVPTGSGAGGPGDGPDGGATASPDGPAHVADAYDEAPVATLTRAAGELPFTGLATLLLGCAGAASLVGGVLLSGVRRTNA